MSLVPLVFRDWWRDLDMDTPIRSSRLLDQHFGTGLLKDDLMSSLWNTNPSVLRTGYIRPWENQRLQRAESKSSVHYDKDKFEVILDVQQFTPNEITVKTSGRNVIVEGKHEEKADEHGYISRHFVRRYQLPSDINPNDVASSLSSDGILSVTAPTKRAAIAPERVVPISQTGPSKQIPEATTPTTSA